MLCDFFPRGCFWLCLLLSYVALARSVALLLVVTINEVGVILSAFSFDYKFIRLPRFLTAFWACRYHLGQNTQKGVLNVWFAIRDRSFNSFQLLFRRNSMLRCKRVCLNVSRRI
jgi:hypothetical protein